jgi:hypothetical protein
MDAIWFFVIFMIWNLIVGASLVSNRNDKSSSDGEKIKTSYNWGIALTVISTVSLAGVLGWKAYTRTMFRIM